ncbi:unnamed protein product [Blepharisma stoltei]|uniref:RING-CH-type domain-containing protein n=1 Tax=Blepharisma stoltei TaxID=1481888 RepID=A0AAU9JA44_9CILI|nr:unnamed protein product [Blepharisma stoltei]
MAMAHDLNSEAGFELNSPHNNRILLSNKIVPASNALNLSSMSVKLSVDNNDSSCRICMEHETPKYPLVSPCLCSGSVKYIHEECLKTWLVAQDKDLAESACEICKAKYKMTFKISSQCSPKHSLKQGFTHFLFIPLLSAVIVMLFVIIYLLIDKYRSDADDKQKGYMMALIIICGLSGVVIFLLICNSIKESCIIAKVTDWSILSQSEEIEESIDPSKQEISKDDIVIERIASIETNVLLIPKKIKIRKRRVQTPTLNPPMVPVYRAGQTVAFTPKLVTEISLMSANSSLAMRKKESKNNTLWDNDQVYSIGKLESSMIFISSNPNVSSP